jgi:hypothetical protein
LAGDVLLTEYAGAQPSFDNPTSSPLVNVPKAQSTRNCRLKEGVDGTTVNGATGALFWVKTDTCVAIGAHVGYSAKATPAARAAVIKFFKQTLAR